MCTFLTSLYVKGNGSFGRSRRQYIAGSHLLLKPLVNIDQLNIKYLNCQMVTRIVINS